MNDDLAERYAAETGSDFSEVMKRWKKDPCNIIEDLFMVRDPDTMEQRPLTLFPYQRKMVHAYFYGQSKTINVYKGRRIGASFIFMVCIFLDGLRFPNTFYPVVGPKKGTAENRLADIYDLADMCVLDIQWKRDNVGLAQLPNGSEFEAFAASVDSDRGDKPARAVVVDEMAFIKGQSDMLAAFRPFISLGTEGKMIQVSTPRTKNDVFMRTHRRGTDLGVDEDGNPTPISIKQPSFKNADDIDHDISLYEQEIHPARPDLDIDEAEELRMSDPQKFAQEYLCRPISDAYSLFDPIAVELAQERGENNRFGPEYTYSGTMVMSLDLAFGGKDDTALAIWEHRGDSRRGTRKLRYYEVVSNETLVKSGISNPDVGFAKHVALRASDLAGQFGVQHIIYDGTGGGTTFDSWLREYTGRGLHAFNFSAQDKLGDMIQDLNYGLRAGNVDLLPGEIVAEQLGSIMKIQKEDRITPKYSGKENAPNGKDDLAIALILGAYPTMLNADGSKNLHGADEDGNRDGGEGESRFREAYNAKNRRKGGSPDPGNRSFGAVSSGRRKYKKRH